MKTLLITLIILLTFSGCTTKNNINTTTGVDKTWDELFDSKEWKPVNSNQENNINNIKKAM